MVVSGEHSETSNCNTTQDRSQEARKLLVPEIDIPIMVEETIRLNSMVCSSRDNGMLKNYSWKAGQSAAAAAAASEVTQGVLSMLVISSPL